jgi:hypothetical protein
MSHVHSHDHMHAHGQDHPHEPFVDRRTLFRTGAAGLGAILLAACGSSNSSSSSVTGGPSTDAAVTDAAVTDAAVTDTAATTAVTEATAPSAVIEAGGSLPGFDAFADSVRAFTSGDVWMIESDGLPSHQMMVGITSWQQQFPVSQPYTGTNAWQFPQTPELADEPISAKTGLFRGAIALAVNGVPIFNALNNRGDDAFLVGELDEFGGHCGRADDYHYHVAPLHLQDVVGSANPIAYALDGFPIYGSVEPDGSPLAALDEYNGHVGSDGVYHYHGTTTYPYLNGGLVGVVAVSDQVDPQPVTPAFRSAGEPLAGAVITGFDDFGDGAYRLEYTLDGQVGSADYTVSDTEVAFEFTSPAGEITTETYSRG